MRNGFLLFVVATMLRACGEMETAQPPEPSVPTPPQSSVLQILPEQVAREPLVAEDLAGLVAENKRLKEAAIAASKANEASDEFAEALIEKGIETVKDVVLRFRFEGDRPTERSVDQALAAMFDTGVYVTQRRHLQSYLNDRDRLMDVREAVLPLLRYMPFPANWRKFLEAGYPVFNTPLTEWPSDLERWYSSYLTGQEGDAVPEFWATAYGAESFSWEAVWWYMFLYRRELEGGYPLRNEWQLTLMDVLSTVNERPEIASLQKGS